ncbi:MFS transporter [Steroidobacter agaridevorans]|uniref:MFS transporter n=1 Tax=Steroidobacter agaridevorans TaxID=2695856 RepID=UPI001322F6CA|nr:MFS transporter [Steroidobacter agaridevorans]GFE90523.1 MFS transporter [Steroidobacter agaridevorans]
MNAAVQNADQIKDVGRTVDVTAVIDSAPLGRFQIFSVVLCGLVAMLDGFDTQSVFLVAPVLAEVWQVAPGDFGPIFGAGLVGILCGQFIAGPLADRYGRRIVILGCTLMFALLTFATAAATSLQMLLLLRFLTGIGLGGATPNIIALTAEFSPQRLRATAITVMFAGFPLGAAIGALISSVIIPAFGWQSVFILGGVIPLALLVVLALRLPESVQFLVAAGRPQQEIGALLDRLVPERERSASERYVLKEQKLEGFSMLHLFRDGRAMKTLLLWVAFFMSLLMIYFLMSWLPLALKQAGASITSALTASVFLNLGGAIGGIVLGRLIDRLDAAAVLCAGYVVAGVSTALIGQVDSHVVILMTCVFVAGFFTIGGQTAMNALTASIYPTQARATGLGTALAVGRIGSVIGPVVGGLLMAAMVTTEKLFLLSALPAVIACAALLVLRLLLRR